MTITPDQLAGIQASHPAAKLMQDGSGEFIFLPCLTIQIGDNRRDLDALLCPHEQGGYDTRLFLSEAIQERPTIKGQAANWTAHQILGRTWYSWSWRGVSASLPLPQMLLAHVKALR